MKQTCLFRAQKRLYGEDVYGSKIKVKVISRPKSPAKQPVPATTTTHPIGRNRDKGPPTTQAYPGPFHQQFGPPPMHPMAPHPAMYPTASHPQHQGFPIFPQFPAIPPVTGPLIPPMTTVAPLLPPAVASRRLMPPISIPGVKPRLPTLNPPGGVDLLVTGMPRESTKTHVRKEIQSKFGRFGKVGTCVSQ